MNLIIGATGNVGRHVVGELARSGVKVRALTRDPASAALPGEAEVVRGDLTDPASLEKALEGAGAVFLLWPFFSAEEAPAVIDAIARRARRIVYLSSMGVPTAPPDSINGTHAAMERLIERSGLEWTFLRAGGFATNTLQWAPQIRAEGVVRWPYAAAARSLIHERDIAAVAVRALGGGHAGARYVLTGPDVVTQAEQVHLIGDAIGRPVRFAETPPDEARRQLIAGGWPATLADGALAGWAAMEREPEPVTSTVEEVTGAPARTFGQWARDHAADFR
jgi:uncharacterized protein YbjT (DUF2867 family)